MSENLPYSFYDDVPAGYNLLEERRPEVLLSYGIPPRPDTTAEPSLFEFWKKLVSPPFSSRRPTFISIEALTTSSTETIAQPPKRRRKQKMPSRGKVEWKWNWSGAIVSPPWPKRIVFATAEWVAPNVSLPSAQALFTHENIPKSLVWVGLDGDNGKLPKISLPQIGTAHWVRGTPHFAWWDWWCKPRKLPKSSPESSPEPSPKAVTPISDFEIHAGDEILAGLEVQVSGDVLLFIKNQTRGEFRSFLAKRPPLDIEPLGSSVEWIVERPTDPSSGQFYPLANYGSVDFKYCLARAVDADKPLAPGRLMTLADNGRMIKMREAFENPYRTVYVSRAARRRYPNGSIGVTCTFHDPNERHPAARSVAGLMAAEGPKAFGEKRGSASRTKPRSGAR
jgi:hypothetical protein